MPPASLPTASLVLPLLVGCTLVVGGGCAWRSARAERRARGGPSLDPGTLLSALAVVVGALLLFVSGPTLALVALVAAALCGLGVVDALRTFARPTGRGIVAEAAPVAASAALFALAVVSAAASITVGQGAVSLLLLFDLRDISWAAALATAVAATSLLHLAASGRHRERQQGTPPPAPHDSAVAPAEPTAAA
ncbi:MULTISPECIES: hypothetical protein [unclassified Rathayibacter]|uniref:hypothetical protein n=1 Tax=unclassified Rathayibacter TaxID=2609250 RepID=UPI001889E5C2|nr:MULTISPECIES: hypothetical protein [unclassified Rathayibacter]MBF4461162.1 hypothetical protein [Rathayibacter sp. VKM Ac-2879]MBF4502573.1 hypothetical protein [Rathayibacter sp. VKM Ac-2878]